jgi:hypothetical protein
VTAAAVAGLVRRLGEALAAQGATAPEVAGAVGGPVRDDGGPGPATATPETEGVADVSVLRIWDSDEANAATIRLERALPLADLEAELGPARGLTRAPSGPPEVAFGGDGDGWSVSAAVEDGDAVRSLSVRRG